MARALRWDDPRCGREHFDARAGVEWECGIDPWDVSGCIPDVRWNKYRETLEPPNRLRFDGGQWAVTDFGLELISDVPERCERYRIPVSSLLAKYAGGRVYWWAVVLAKEPWVDLYAFEVALKKALEIHRLTADESILYKSFRTARALARSRARDKWIKPNLPPRLPKVREAMCWVVVERLLDVHEKVWLRCQSPRGYPTVLAPRPADANDMRVIKAAYPTFFSPGHAGPHRIYCAARWDWQSNDWFLLASEQPRAA